MSPVQQFVRSIQIVYGAIIGGSAFFMLISLYLVANMGPLSPLDKPTITILLAVANISGLSGVYGGLISFKARIKDIDRQSIEKKLETYRSAMILRAAMLEGAVLFFVVIYLISGNILAIAEAALFISFLGFYFPTVLRIAQETGIDPREMH